MLHIINKVFYWDDSMLSLGTDRGYSEIYQYIKWFWIIFLLVYLSFKKRSFSYNVWGLFFTYLLLDDALQFHEIAGAIVARGLPNVSFAGLRIQDIGELMVSGTVGLVLLLLVLLTYILGSKVFRKLSHDMVLLIAVLIFCGVVVDVVHTSINANKVIKGLLGLIEDGGEMVVVSIICWYVFLQNIRNEEDKVNLFDFLYFNLIKRSA
ncbi:hypothetical protein [Plebeiibacterium sediminum]|uniref:Uncharacterized protein n=1 Tax=Plebeiibacterium sediminum TaxID=2992112 RepID=A0AAE3SE82_9BACT|nr:hypothetical protein [Plebeiobacterium sediminum]MCW3786223.1 hypothetical protein [Plebeiobacterium sediminum]